MNTDYYELLDLLTQDQLPSQHAGITADFNEYLAKTKADAWDEAVGECAEQGTIQVPDNPYRIEDSENTK